jgi:hypothetical protein
LARFDRRALGHAVTERGSTQRWMEELTGGPGRLEGEGVLTGGAQLSAGGGEGEYPFGF